MLCVLPVNCWITFDHNVVITLIMNWPVQQPLQGLNADPTDMFLRAEQLTGEAFPPQPSQWTAECATVITRLNFYNLTKWEAEKQGLGHSEWFICLGDPKKNNTFLIVVLCLCVTQRNVHNRAKYNNQVNTSWYISGRPRTWPPCSRTVQKHEDGLSLAQRTHMPDWTLVHV